MNRIKILCVTCIFLCASQSVFAKHWSEVVAEASDYDITVLEKFFRALIHNEEVGYVLFGEKPVCASGIYRGEDTFIGSFVARSNVLYREGIDVWEKLQLSKYQKEIFIKRAKFVDPKNPDWIEFTVFNKRELERILEENKIVFQAILGPKFSAKRFLCELENSDSSIADLLKNSLTLIGVVLGYGVQNALWYNRYEIIGNSCFIPETPPFSAQFEYAKEIKNLEEVKSMFLDYSHYSTDFTKTKLLPSFGYDSIGDEFNDVESNMKTSSLQLIRNDPKFIFGRFEDSSKLIERLERAQNKIGKLLKSETFLEDVLTLIFAEPAKIPVRKLKYEIVPTLEERHAFPFLIASTVDGDDMLYIDDFIDGMMDADRDSSSEMALAKVGNLNKLYYPEVLIEARENLEKAKTKFTSLAKNSKCKEIVPQKLYYRIIREGNGEDALSQAKAIVHFKITSLDGDTLIDTRVYSNPRKMNLSEVIPGFAHGMRGMRVGEIRRIWIHPDFAYGMYTTLKKCMALKVEVELFEIPQSYLGDNLLSLKSLDVEKEIALLNQGDLLKYKSAVANYRGFLFWRYYKKGSDWYFLEDIMKELRKKNVGKAVQRNRKHLDKLKLLICDS